MQRALRLALALLPSGPVRYEDVVANCDDVIALLDSRGEQLPDRDLFVKEVESRVLIWQDRSTSLDDNAGHEDWLDSKRQQIEWRFWDRYRRYLEEVELLPPAVIGRTDESTDRVLSKLEDPARTGPWDRRGLVVGHVQSGKTGHYTALTAKAADAGYKLIVILAGMHNSLRSQTQLRIDQGILGFDTQYQYRYDEQTQSRIGVGLMAGAEALKVASLTTSHDRGDFRKGKAKDMAIPIGDFPVILVVKKHGGILDNLRSWVTKQHGRPLRPDSDELIVDDIPLLVIDDEADTASINTNSPDRDPAVINQRIRSLLQSFSKSAYVGYTATPFANIYSSTSEDDTWGMDLFPRHFIESLKAPSNYFGPVRVFGLAGNDDEDSVEPLPIYRKVEDYENWMPDKHSQHWHPLNDSFPKSLRQAMLSFLLVCAARRARGQVTNHNTMLIHVTRLQKVQERVADQVEDVLSTIRYRLRYGDGDGPSIMDELQQLWETDFELTSKQWDDAKPLAWSSLVDHIQPATDKIKLKTINGSSEDALEYYDERQSGLSVIAIGGNKLSRGLTLEGLSVSYYLRTTRMYDTLMQMGRWFGYRPGYEDLCRLYTTPTLRSWYREITMATEELRQDFDEMATKRATPEDFGLRVRQSSAGLSVTSPTKMRSAKAVTLTFSGDISETVTFDIHNDVLSANRRALDDFVCQLMDSGSYNPDMPAGNYIWKNVPGSIIADEFFQRYRADKLAHRARPELIASYIRKCNAAGELANWTVALINNTQVKMPAKLAGLDVGLTFRRPLINMDELKETRRYTIRRVLNPVDESIDLESNPNAIAAALKDLSEILKAKATPERPYKEPTYPRGPSLRRQRSAENGLLLIYLLNNRTDDDEQFAEEPLVGWAVSFPFSAKRIVEKYQVNEIWRLLSFDELAESDTDD